ncbi:MAG: hypothetical protein AAGA06_13075 [Pseudomonadota bacterium]
MKAIKLCAAFGVIGLLAACAQQEEPPVIKPQPVYDKFGGSGSCVGGYIYVPGTVPELDECIPEDECDPVYAADGSLIDCIPPSRFPDPGGDDDNDRGRTSTGTTAAGGPRP